MEFKYSFVEDGPHFIMEIEPNENITGFIYHIGGWLSSDVPIFEEDFIQKVKAVLESENPDEELFYWGNSYQTTIGRYTTTIKYTYEEENPHMVPCTLPTQMLCEILEIWIKAYEEHREKTKKKEERRKKNNFN